MKKNNNLGQWCHGSDRAVMDFPMTLLIITIVSAVAIVFFTASGELFLLNHQEEQVKTMIANVCDSVSTMNIHSSEESQIILTIFIPSKVETVIFGSKSLTAEPSLNNSSHFSYHNRSCILYQMNNKNPIIIHSPVAFSDENGDPLILLEGTYSILFEIRQIDNEVVAIGSIL
jgi:hypothetical protein